MYTEELRTFQSNVGFQWPSGAWRSVWGKRVRWYGWHGADGHDERAQHGFTCAARSMGENLPSDTASVYGGHLVCLFSDKKCTLTCSEVSRITADPRGHAATHGLLPRIPTVASSRGHRSRHFRVRVILHQRPTAADCQAKIFS